MIPPRRRPPVPTNDPSQTAGQPTGSGWAATTGWGRSALSPEGLPDDLLAEIPRRLTWASTGGAILFLLVAASQPFRPAAAQAHGILVSICMVGAACCVLIALVSRTSLPRARVHQLSTAFAVSVATAMWGLELSAPFATTTHTPGVPTVSAWMLFFPAIVPLPFRSALLTAVLSTLAGPAVLAAFVASGQPAPDASHAGLWFVAAAAAGGGSLITSSVLQRAFLGLHRARQVQAYTLEARIGQGGMGEVYVGRHARLLRQAAIKVIRAETLRDAAPDVADTLHARFELEAKVTSQLRSPHTVELYDYGVADDGRLFYAMELLDGTDLHKLVQQHGAQPPARVVHILRGVCDSLAEAHAAGLVHRDIKPSNIMICRLGRQVDVTKVLDFGTVRPPSSSDPAPAGSTAPPGTARAPLVGTPSYSAPETHLGPVGPRADLYAVGCVAWWLLTGQTLFRGASLQEVLQAHAFKPLPDLRDMVAKPLPEELVALVTACLRKDPSERPPDADALGIALDRLAVHHPWTQDMARAWWTDRPVGPAPLPADPTLAGATLAPTPTQVSEQTFGWDHLNTQ